MNASQTHRPFQDFRGFFRSGSVHSRLILINVIVFLAVNLIYLFLWLFRVDPSSEGIPVILDLFGVPASIGKLIIRPWTLFTYMFLQEDFFHIFFNMVILYFGGSIFTEYLGGKKLLITYVLGGLSGALFFILAYNLFPVFSPVVGQAIALGASASVLAILIAAATFIPEYSVQLILFGKIKLKYIALILVIVDIFSISRDNPGGHIAHLGGALFGFIYAINLRKGRELFGFLGKHKVANPFKQRRKPADPSFSYQRPMTDQTYNEKRAVHQQRVDEILDKIAKGGYDSLTREEKEFLFKASGKNK
ncbi:MAG: rhomboid family intramembrane serine protease [Bacteroidetes bacterium]|nr:rhomboid family intramembrane serine protease [Bacteroidota bacterium]